MRARVKTALRHGGGSRMAPAHPSVFTCGGLEINFAMRRVRVDGVEVKLTPTEYSVLQQLAVNTDKVLTHRMLLPSVWGSEYCSEKEYLRVFIARLRTKIELDPEHPKYILTMRGVGSYIDPAP